MGSQYCAECGREIQSGVYINGRFVCDWCQPTERTRTVTPVVKEYKTIAGKLYRILVEG